MVGAPADGKKPKGLQLHVHFALPTLPQKKKIAIAIYTLKYRPLVLLSFSLPAA